MQIINSMFYITMKINTSYCPNSWCIRLGKTAHMQVNCYSLVPIVTASNWELKSRRRGCPWAPFGTPDNSSVLGSRSNWHSDERKNILMASLPLNRVKQLIENLRQNFIPRWGVLHWFHHFISSWSTSSLCAHNLHAPWSIALLILW